MEKKLNTPAIRLPEGKFCGGNCSDCIYYDRSDRKSDGRCYCTKMNTYCYPSERQGCFHYVKGW